MAGGNSMALVLVMNLLFLLFLVALVRSDQSTMPLKSFTIGGNVTYDCINIYKQPGLDHPLLKNHTIQMKPSRGELKSQIGNNSTQNKKTKCPDGTIPILRNTKEFIPNAQFYADQHVHPLSADRHGAHFAIVRSQTAGPYRGIAAWYTAFNLDNIGKDQASYSQLYVGSNKFDFISTGLIINPGFFGDGRVWSYGFWKGKYGKGCYNTACSGFVQVSRITPIVKPIDIPPGWPYVSPREIYGCRRSIHQDKNTGNWWITKLNKNAPDEDIGYWPKEIFNILGDGANMVGVGGVVHASPSGSSPPMGNGKFPIGDRTDSALITNIDVLNSNYEQSRISKFPIDILVDSPNCYGLRVGKVKRFFKSRLGYFFNYGGPGGISCGV